MDRVAVMDHLKEEPYSGRDKTYIPHPATYLNQRRWETDIETADDPFADWLNGGTYIDGVCTREH
jgi:hypothetical protein